MSNGIFSPNHILQNGTYNSSTIISEGDFMFEKELCYGQYMGFIHVLSKPPHAMARIRGSEKYPEIMGVTRFYQTNCGVLVATEVAALPYLPGSCEHFIFALHIHEGGSCTGNEEDLFAGAKMHYNPALCPHPRHAGDLPPLFGNEGYAFSIFLTDRFTVDEVIGKTIIIHGSPDDFKTQPSGNAGEKIACGVIK